MPQQEQQEQEQEEQEVPEEAGTDVEAQGPDPYSILEKVPGAPTKEQVEQWKVTYEIKMSMFSEKEVFLWKPITWQEYKMLQQAASDNQQNPNYFDEQLVYKCVVWPQIMPETLPTLKGGTIPTLSQQIMEGSNFIPPQMAMNLVVDL